MEAVEPIGFLTTAVGPAIGTMAEIKTVVDQEMTTVLVAHRLRDVMTTVAETTLAETVAIMMLPTESITAQGLPAAALVETVRISIVAGAPVLMTAEEAKRPTGLRSLVAMVPMSLMSRYSLCRMYTRTLSTGCSVHSGNAA